ncbi:MAG: hypothetical protein WC780_17985 [Lentimicrobiaceae bacterium]|jgi:Trk K+ transport system NAD-binding subunit
MKIVRTGAGEVGTHVALKLSGEKQDIILPDDVTEKLHYIDLEIDSCSCASYFPVRARCVLK